jgi:hypothetical protein
MELRERLTSAPVVELTEVELDRLRASGDTVRDDNTSVAGRIQILSLDGMFVVQEKTPERRIVVCVMPSIERAQSFVDERLATYDKMWDG